MKRPITPNWTAKIGDPDTLLVDIEDIEQSIYIILSTIKGTDPQRPEFGSEVPTFIGMPINSAITALVNDVHVSLGLWEKRLNVEQVSVIEWGVDSRIIRIKGTVIASANQVELNINI